MKDKECLCLGYYCEHLGILKKKFINHYYLLMEQCINSFLILPRNYRNKIKFINFVDAYIIFITNHECYYKFYGSTCLVHRDREFYIRQCGVNFARCLTQFILVRQTSLRRDVAASVRCSARRIVAYNFVASESLVRLFTAL